VPESIELPKSLIHSIAAGTGWKPVIRWVPLLLVVLGCSKSATMNAARSDAPRFLALGDSYTIGESVSPAERWPEQLVVMLRDGGVDVADPQIIATTGWTTDELVRGIDAAKADLRPPYALVSLMIGVNNQYRGRDVEEYRTQFSHLLRRAIEFAGNQADHVIVLSIPDWGVTPFGKSSGRDVQHIAQEIDRFNTVARKETDRAGAHFIDLTPVSRAASSDASLVADDGLHPSAAMHRKWAELVVPVAKSLFQRQSTSNRS
jgi:lysophospholipase L1-like esterase